MEHSVSVALKHFGMDVETGVAKLSDLFGQQLHSVDRIAENDGLVDLQLQPQNTHGIWRSILHSWLTRTNLGEEGVEAVHLLPFLHKCIVLQHGIQS